MSSRSGPRAAGTDGTDFQHRQRVAAQYQTSAQYKWYIKWLFAAHFIVLAAMWAKLFGEIAVTHLGVKSSLWKRLDLPTAYPWEYVWCLSFIPIILGLYALPRNRVKVMTYAYYFQFFTGILPLMIGLGSQFPELIDYIQDPKNSKTPTFKGQFPMVALWFMFFLIAFQLHMLGMYFKYYLLAAWDPLVVREEPAVVREDPGAVREDPSVVRENPSVVRKNVKNEREKKSD